MKRQGNGRNGQQGRELSAQQQAAAELLAAGKTDLQIAETLNLPSVCITKWRLYDPIFQAGLNACRAAIWQASIDRLRSMIPQALDTLAAELNRADNPDRPKIALDILRLAKLPDIAPQGPSDAETIVRRAVDHERSQARGPLDFLTESDKGLPSYDDHVARKWAELESKAADGPPQGAASP
jgi:hypothetical protein